MNDAKVITQNDYSEQLKDFYEQSIDIVSQIQQGVRVKKDITTQANQLKEQLRPLLQSIAQNGEILKYNWVHLRSLIVIQTRDILFNMQKQYPYKANSDTSETFEDELDIVLQFLCVFETKPPFTLQRICELLIDPEKHYKSTKKILFAMEKLVNVSA